MMTGKNIKLILVWQKGGNYSLTLEACERLSQGYL